jgi:hypothetical protein
MVAGITTSLVATAVLIAPVASRADTYPPAPSSSANAGQPFASSVVAEYHNLARRADPLAARKTIGPDATDCKHQEGITRKDAPDGTPYLFISRSGKDPGVACFVDDEPGTIYVLKMGSRNRDGERMQTNLLPYDGSALKDRPNVASGEDVVVKAIKLGTDGFPSYMHPGGMQAIGDLLVIGTEDPIDNPGASQATVMFVNVADPANPEFIGQLDIQDPGDEAGSDPVGLTVVKDGDGQQHYLLVTAGGPANKEVRFYRSPVLTASDALDPTHWELVGTYTYVELTTCFGGSYLVDGSNWPIGTGFFDTGQHQMLNFVRQGDLDGPLFLFGGRRDGAIVNPFANEYLDLYQVNLTADGLPMDCPLSEIQNGTRQMGQTSMGQPLDTGSFSAASSMYVSPAGELMVYEAPHENGDVILFGQFRALDLVSHTSPLLHPTATVDGPVVVDEGSSVLMTGHGQQAQTKAFVELFSDEGAGEGLSDPVWFPIEYGNWAEIGSENLQNSVQVLFDINSLPYESPLIWEEATSMRWFAPPGCTIAATDYPITSNSWPGPDTVLLRGTGKVETVTDLHHMAVYKPAGEQWPLAPVPDGVTPTDHDFNDDIEGISFTKPVDDNGTVFRQLGCDNYYDATIGLNWDTNNDGTYDTTASTFALFSAAQLDGPTTRTVTARAQHPSDTSDLGIGAPFSFPVTVRNVPPQVQEARVLDSLGHDLTAAGSIAIVGLPVSLSVDFTDPGVADTQTASVDWGDGTTSTTFDSFNDAFGGNVGHLASSHTYTSPGAHTITTTLTDDDGGATPVSQTIQVLSLKDALAATADQLTALIGATTNGKIAAALTSARDELIGNHGGKPPTNGALDKLNANDPVGAITKIQAAIADLATAESFGAGDLSALKDLLGLVAQGIATDAQQKALAAIPAPSPGQLKSFATIAGLIALGHQQLLAHQYSSACDNFRQATSKALVLLK